MVLKRFTSLLLLVGSVALAEEPKWGANDVQTVFAIGKSDDGNQVQYGVHLDSNCQVVGKEPVIGYWRELDKGPTAPLKTFSFIDGFGYGITSQTVKADKTTVSITIKTAAKRVIDIVASKQGEKCVAQSFATIGGRRAELKGIFIHLNGPLSVAWVNISGVAVETGKEVVERVTP